MNLKKANKPHYHRVNSDPNICTYTTTGVLYSTCISNGVLCKNSSPKSVAGETNIPIERKPYMTDIEEFRQVLVVGCLNKAHSQEV